METIRRLADLQRTFVAPKGLARSRPRDVQLTLGGRALAAVAVLLFASAVAAGVVMYHEAQRQADTRRALVDAGVTTTGAVTRLWPNGEHRRQVLYRFVVDGRVYEGEARVSTERRRTLEIGAPLDVRYVPTHPEKNDLGGTPPTEMPMWLPFPIAAVLAAMGVACLFVLNGQRQLLTEGRAAPAVVMTHARQHTTHGGTHPSITYQFRLLSGAVASGKAGTSSKPPAIGSVICVVYDPDRPSRSMVYPLPLVRPAP